MSHETKARRSVVLGDLATVLVCAGLLLVAAAIGIDAWVNHARAAEVRRKRVDVPMPGLTAHLAREDSVLAGYRWIDRGAGRIGLPIDRAMQLVIDRSPEGVR